VRLHGRGFLALGASGDGLLCQFGANAAQASEAVPVNDTVMTCRAPPVWRASTVPITLRSRKPELHRVVLGEAASDLRQRSFTYYRPPVITSVTPPRLSRADYSEPTFTATLDRDLEIQDGLSTSILCRLELLGSAREPRGTSRVNATLVTDRTLWCPFASLRARLKDVHECSLSVSFNGGIDYSTPYRGIDVLDSAIILGASSSALERSDSTRLSINVTGSFRDDSELSCHVEALADDREWFLPAQVHNTTHAVCIDPAALLPSLPAGEVSVGLHDALVGRVS